MTIASLAGGRYRPIVQSLAEGARSLTDRRADDPREVALVDKPEIGREPGQTLLPVGQAIEGDRDPNPIPELAEGHPGRSRKDLCAMF